MRRDMRNATGLLVDPAPPQLSGSFDNSAVPLLISVSNYGPFSGSTGSIVLPASSLRNVDSEIRTAYAPLWSVTLEHQFGKEVVVGASRT